MIGKNIWKLNLIFSGIIILLVFRKNCSKDPVSSEIKPEPDAVQTIDAQGGVLENEELSIRIPSGAFESPHKLKLYSETHNDFADNAATKSFEIEGLPQVYNKNLRLCIKHDGNLTTESYIAKGHWRPNLFIDDTTFLYTIYAAKDSGGYLVCQLPPTSKYNQGLARQTGLNNNPEAFNLNIKIRGLKNYLMDLTNEHFNIYFPYKLSHHIPQLKTQLGDCYKIISEDLGFNLDQHSWAFPMDVYVTDIRYIRNRVVHADGAYYGLNGPLIAEDLKGTPYLNISKLSLTTQQFDEIKEDAGLGLMHITLTLNGGLNPTLFNADHRWLAAAVLNWSEEYFTSKENFIAPDYFKGHELAPFNGLRTGAEDEYFISEKHGRGISAVIKYLADDQSFGPQGSASVYDLISVGTYPASALINSVNGLVADWWPGFFHEYVAGHIYDVDQDFFLDPANICRTWDIDTEKDTLMIFPSSDVEGYDHLSAKLFLVNLNYSEIESSANLLVDADGVLSDDGIAVLVYGLHNNVLQFLGETINEEAAVELENLKDYYDNNWRQFLIVVVNSMHIPPFRDESEIDLTLKLKKASPEPVYRECAIMLKCHRHYYQEHADGSTDYNDIDNTINSNYREGSFNNNVFTSTYTYINDDSTYKKEGTIKVVLNTEGDKVENVEWNQTYNLIHSNYERIISFSAENLPFDPSYGSSQAYGVIGPESVNHITHFTHDMTSDSYNHTLQSYEGNNNSRIVVFLRE